ncbi:MAG: hypothetical protein EOP48_11975 [Sphingobacteriales bacterium]|nr:MAG: hypothetical protein EOP48_11975 [Sphingobacteriales bacterium]
MNKLQEIAFNCHQATMLIEKKQLAGLTIREKFELQLHLTGCSACKLYQRQSTMINRQIKKLFHATTQKDHVLDDDYKKRLQEQIEKKLK